jgi:NAD(P)H-flavin reductase/hemoglobin-like flavoprotein
MWTDSRSSARRRAAATARSDADDGTVPDTEEPGAAQVPAGVHPEWEEFVDTPYPPVTHVEGPLHVPGADRLRADEAGTLAANQDFGSFDVEALRESMECAEERADEFSKALYAHMFADQPGLRALFPASLEASRVRMMQALSHVVGNIDNRSELVPYLKALGRDHRKFGVDPRHYAPVGGSLIAALRTALGSQLTPRHERAWTEVFEAISTVMIHGAEEDAVISPAWWDAEVVFHRRVLDDVAVIQVRPHTSYPYRPGQYCSLMTPRRPQLWRSYSLASAPRDDGLLEFHIRAVGAGWVSSSLVWKTEPGDVLRLGAPRGKDLANPRSESDLLCICAGTGVAPIIATMQELEQRQDGRRVHIFYAGRDRDHLYALPHLESIGVRYRRLTVVPVVSPEGPQDLSPEMMGNVVTSYGDWQQHSVYVAGHSNMVQTTLERLREHGVTDQQVTHDDYGMAW